MLKKYTISSFCVLVLIGCTNKTFIQSDLLLTKEMGFDSVPIAVADENRVVFNVEQLNPFNFVLISTDSSVFGYHHKKGDSLFILDPETVVQMDTIGKPLGPFKKGYTFKIIIGNKAKDPPPPFGLDMQGHMMVNFAVVD